MNTNYKIILAFILGIMARIFTSPWILGYNDKYYSLHKNKIYDAVFLGSITGIIQIIIDFGSLSLVETIIWITLFLSIFFTMRYFIDNQIFVASKHLLLKLRENYAESNKLAEILLNDNKLNKNTKNFVLEHKTLKEDAIKTINELIANET